MNPLEPDPTDVFCDTTATAVMDMNSSATTGRKTDAKRRNGHGRRRRESINGDVLIQGNTPDGDSGSGTSSGERGKTTRKRHRGGGTIQNDSGGEGEAPRRE